jgi:hypothetical protein
MNEWLKPKVKMNGWDWYGKCMIEAYMENVWLNRIWKMRDWIFFYYSICKIKLVPTSMFNYNNKLQNDCLAVQKSNFTQSYAKLNHEVSFIPVCT